MPRGVLHCWTGTPDEMKQFLDLGFYISFSGIVTFPKAHAIHGCGIVPSDKYLIETDAPFLAPVPHRGKEMNLHLLKMLQIFSKIKIYRFKHNCKRVIKEC